MISDQANKITFIQSDLDLKTEEFDKLNDIKIKLKNKNNELTLDLKDKERQLMTLSQTNEFYDEVRMKEVSSVQSEFEKYMAKMEIERMGNEDIYSNLVRAGINLERLEYLYSELESKNTRDTALLETQLIELTSLRLDKDQSDGKMAANLASLEEYMEKYSEENKAKIEFENLSLDLQQKN